MGHRRAGKGLSEPPLEGGWAGAEDLEWLHGARVDVMSPWEGPARFLRPGRRLWCHPTGSVPTPDGAHGAALSQPGAPRRGSGRPPPS